MKTQKTDVIIIGGGAIGLAAAASLARSGLSVLLLDKGAAPAPPSSTQGRVVVLNQQAQKLLEDLQVWEAFLRPSAGAIEKMCLSFPNTATQGFILSSDTPHDNLGMTLLNQNIIWALYTQCQQLPKIQMRWNTSLDALRVEQDRTIVNHKDEAACVIAADGSYSKVRQLLALTTNTTPYAQSAHVASIRTQLPHDKTAFQWFLPQGPLAFLPLKDPHEISIVWTQSSACFAQHAQLDDEAFCRALSVASNHELGFVTQVGPKMHFPLKGQKMSEAVHTRVVFIGDAWHTIHPLAGQGMNLGFKDVAVLHQVLARAHQAAADIGDVRILRQYENLRKGANNRMSQLMSVINDLTTVQKAGMPALQGAAFGLLNKMPWLRKRLVAVAQGE